MRGTGSQRGEGRLSVIIAIALMVVVGFAASRVIPVRVDAFEFKDFLEQETRTAALHPNDSEVAKRILAKAKELEIPLDPKNLKVERTLRTMRITASYDQPIDLKLTTYVYRFSTRYEAPLF